ncbi:MAG: hypothetical protein F6K17_23720 [Okeania sp. SIO3C4]|nr:hypothetical protein [Okeania sp. SIO3C4]
METSSTSGEVFFVKFSLCALEAIATERRDEYKCGGYPACGENIRKGERERARCPFHKTLDYRYRENIRNGQDAHST